MFWIMPEGNRKPDPPESDPAALAKLLELELIQKRAAWQRSRSNLRSLRVVSFFFLFLVILGALFAFFFLFSPDRVQEMKSADPSATASP